MPTLEDVRTICGDLPETEERTSRGRAMWHVGRGHAFVWERPFTKADVGREGEPPPGDLLAVAVADEGEKEALIRAEPDWFFTISHFDGHPMLLLRLDAVPLTAFERSWWSRGTRTPPPTSRPRIPTSPDGASVRAPTMMR